jgi:hypothetical protein
MENKGNLIYSHPDFDIHAEVLDIRGSNEVFFHITLRERRKSTFKALRSACEALKPSFLDMGIGVVFILLREDQRDTERLARFCGFTFVTEDEGYILYSREVK